MILSMWHAYKNYNFEAYIVRWGNDGTKITNLFVTFHQSFTTRWHHFNPQMQNFIDNFHVPSLVYRSLCMRKYLKTKSQNYSIDWENVGTYEGKVGTMPHLYPMIYVFYRVRMVHKKIIDYNQVKSAKKPSKKHFNF